VTEDKPDRKVIRCNHHVGTRAVAEGAAAYVVQTNVGNGNDRIKLLSRSRGGRWIEGWHATDRLENFRVKTLPPEHPLYDNDRLLDAQFGRSLLGAFAVMERVRRFIQWIDDQKKVLVCSPDDYELVAAAVEKWRPAVGDLVTVMAEPAVEKGRMFLVSPPAWDGPI
jgi:hypothetical protein